MNRLSRRQLCLAALRGVGGAILAAELTDPRPAAAQPVPRSPGQGKLLLWRDTRFVFLTPDGKQVGELPDHPERLILNQPMLSPDGRSVAFTVNEDPPTDEGGNVRRHVLVRAVNGQGPGFKIAVNALNVAWTPDGKGLVAAELLPAKEQKDQTLAAWLIDARSGEKTRIVLPGLTHVFALTPDSKSFVAGVYDLDARKIHLALVGRDGKAVTRLTEIQTEGPSPRPAPDGSRLLFLDYDPAEKPDKDVPRLPRLFTIDLRTKKRERLADVPLNALVLGHCWSPDGRRVAYTWKRAEPGVPLAANTGNMNDPKLNTETESHLVIADADGKNPRTLLSGKANSGPTLTIGAVDWR